MNQSLDDDRPGVVRRLSDLRSFRPLLWVVAGCLAFWIAVAMAWPWYVAGLLAVLSGMAFAWALGEALSRRLTVWREDRAWAEELRREAVREAAREAIQAQQEKHDGRAR